MGTARFAGNQPKEDAIVLDMGTKLHLESPIKLRIHTDETETRLRGLLSYKDKKVDYELYRMKHATWFVNKYGKEAYDIKIQELKAQRDKCLLFQDAKGYWTYSGMHDSLERQLSASMPDATYNFPASKIIPWAQKPFNPYPYQQIALEKLLAARHAGVEMATGLGKSLIITYLLKELGLQALVMAPSVSIARQLYDGLCSALGTRYVGLFGDGARRSDKLITVGISGSLTRVTEGSPAWEELSRAQVFVADESHLCPAATLAKVCFGLAKDAPYRFFFSATQLRNDGLDMLLEAITGPIVYRMDIRDGIDQGYLAKLRFTMVNVRSPSVFSSKDANEMTREHLFYNPRVNSIAAGLVNRFVSQSGYQVLVLVDELEQFNHLLPHLRHEVAFAHGGSDAPSLPAPYRKPDVPALVRRFNDGGLPILVGTSCVSIGTDIKSNRATINLRGGKSEIEVMQGAVGRSTRLHAPVNKTSCEVVDFDVVNIDVLRRHAKARRALYDAAYGPVHELEVGGI